MNPAADGVLKDKVAIVTGGGRGIGRAIGLALAREGASVVVAARTNEEIAETAALIECYGRKALHLPVDVTKQSDVEALIDRTLGAFHRIDILVNNSGVLGPVGPLAENDPAAWIEAIHVNLYGTFLCSRAALPAMMRQRAGKVINISGGGATAARPRFSAYAASKAAIVRLTETLADEVREYNIQVNAIAPGAVSTRMLDAVIAAGELAGEQVLPDAEHAARLAVFLASDASNGLTGKLISALHDGWEQWDRRRISEIMSAPWLTLRRMDPYTLKPFVPKLT